MGGRRRRVVASRDCVTARKAGTGSDSGTGFDSDPTRADSGRGDIGDGDRSAAIGALPELDRDGDDVCRRRTSSRIGVRHRGEEHLPPVAEPRGDDGIEIERREKDVLRRSPSTGLSPVNASTARRPRA